MFRFRTIVIMLLVALLPLVAVADKKSASNKDLETCLEELKKCEEETPGQCGELRERCKQIATVLKVPFVEKEVTQKVAVAPPPVVAPAPKTKAPLPPAVPVIEKKAPVTPAAPVEKVQTSEPPSYEWASWGVGVLLREVPLHTESAYTGAAFMADRGVEHTYTEDAHGIGNGRNVWHFVDHECLPGEYESDFDEKLIEIEVNAARTKPVGKELKNRFGFEVAGALAFGDFDQKNDLSYSGFADWQDGDNFYYEENFVSGETSGDILELKAAFRLLYEVQWGENKWEDNPRLLRFLAGPSLSLTRLETDTDARFVAQATDFPLQETRRFSDSASETALVPGADIRVQASFPVSEHWSFAPTVGVDIKFDDVTAENRYVKTTLYEKGDANFTAGVFLRRTW